MTARTIAIGDIHGCATALDTLLDVIAPENNDTVVTLGDYVDRGPDSNVVIERLIELGGRCRLIPLLGNHETLMLEALRDGDLNFWLTCGGFDTVRSYGGKLNDIPLRHINFLSKCPKYWETEDHFFVHANYRADLPLSAQPDHTLLWEHITFSMPGPHDSGKTAVVGHTPQRTHEILDLTYLKCIDTLCVGGGWLTALDVTTGQQWQANMEGELRI
jgi:serine/threonine protein phosphatase 1